MPQTDTFIYGKHALKEALTQAPYALRRLYIEQGSREPELAALARKAGVELGSFAPGQPPRGVDRDAAHQGVVGLVQPDKLLRQYREFVDSLTVTPDTSLVVLGELQDPQNVGAVIRSAAAFGVAGVLVPEYRQATITGTVVKVSAGMAFRVPLINIGNVNTALRDLKERGFWVYGLDETAELSVSSEQFDRPSVFVLGNEARGLREKTRELCDILVSIPIHPRCESLNAAASAAVALYAWSSQHPNAIECGK